jgi:hypothetical protein
MARQMEFGAIATNMQVNRPSAAKTSGGATQGNNKKR